MMALWKTVGGGGFENLSGATAELESKEMLNIQKNYRQFLLYEIDRRV